MDHLHRFQKESLRFFLFRFTTDNIPKRSICRKSKVLICFLLCALLWGTISAYSIAKSEGPANLALKVMVINFDPVFSQANGKKQHDLVEAWRDPRESANQYIPDMRTASHGNVDYQISEWYDRDDLPRAVNGQSYSKENYYNTLIAAINSRWDYWSYSGWQHFGQFDYNYYLTLYNVYGKVESGAIDEVWVFAGPCTGADAYETIMVGKDAYWCNSPAMVRSDCNAFVCTYFNYEREVGCMLENSGHRMESIMSKVFGRWNTSLSLGEMNDWEKFTLYDKIAPGNSAAGNVHFAPNSQSDYDWGNSAYVMSTCDDWKNYPNLTSSKSRVNASKWGYGDMRLHHLWWFELIPHVSGATADSVLNNWWIYFKYPTYVWSAPASKPDLAPTAITYDKNVAAGKEIYFDSGVANKGETNANSFNIKWYVNNEQKGYGWHDGVPANSTVMNGNSQFYWTPTSPGSYKITFSVDCDDSVGESNESNNSTSITVVVPQPNTSWKAAYKTYLKRYFKARYYEYVGLMDIGRDGTPEMIYIEQNSSRRNPRMRIIGMVGKNAKIVSTRDYGRLLEGYSLYIRRNGSNYGCYAYSTYYSKDKKYMYENTTKISQISSYKYSYIIVYGYRQKLKNGSEVYTVEGQNATSEKYSEYGSIFEDSWALCEPGVARIGRHSSLNFILQHYDQEAAAYSMPY